MPASWPMTNTQNHTPQNDRELDVTAASRELMIGLSRRFPKVPEHVLEDAIATAWLRYVEPRHRLTKSPIGWLFVVARNEVIATLRQYRRTQPVADVPAT